ncbi:MAG: glycerol-3-phosphate dehydrogenase [Alteromonas macleodii]|jgi:glycerol-3-phosphate dehydrogenase
MTLHSNPIEDFDVVIVGAGINGAGVFHDLCHQGIRCLIIEKRDFGSGTSAAPSRLIHGGLKYLETGEFGLVAESTFERNLLLKNAPHLVKPLPTIIPVRSWANGLWSATRTFFGFKAAFKSRGALLIKIGLIMYDLFGRKERVMPKHKMRLRGSALRHLPALRPDIVGTGVYFDAMITAPERLVLELIQDGCAAMPSAKAMNWTALVGSENGTLILDKVGKKYCVRPKLVINAAGPWIDAANLCLGETTKLIGGTKGSHIVIKNDALVAQLNGHMVYFEGDDGRILLVFPYHGRALVGSTDITADDPDNLVCDDSEVGYFMYSLRVLFPSLTFDTDQIVYSYSGIRPLPNSEGVQPGLISRDHSAPVLEPTLVRPYAIISLIGGKWTTYRGFAQSVTNLVLGRLGKYRKVSTQFLKIGGGRNYPTSEQDRQEWIDNCAAQTGLSSSEITPLLKRYGTQANAAAVHIAAFLANRLLIGTHDYSVAEIDWIARTEKVQHLEDVILRRTLLAVTGALSNATLIDIAGVTGSALGWTDEKIAQEIQDTIIYLQKRHRMYVSTSE